MKVAVIGAAGQLGTDLVKAVRGAGHAVIPLVHTQVDVTDPAGVGEILIQARPEAVINCAAFHRVDDCEDRPDEAFRVNALGALLVARACAELDAECVYISTDYVFDGEKGEAYTEDDVPNPINVYGVSKLAGEHLVRQTAHRWLIARVASLFGVAGASGKGGNFIETILAKARAGQPLRVVHDITMSPTHTADAAERLAALISIGATGVVHLTNAGACTWYEFARQILELTGTDARLEPVPASSYPSKARRPRNSALRSVRLAGLGGAPRPWALALQAYLIEKGHLTSQAVGQRT